MAQRKKKAGRKKAASRKPTRRKTTRRIVAAAAVPEPGVPDERLRRDWNLRMVRAREALALVRGTSGTVDWRDVAAGHIDTGYSHNPVFRFDAHGSSPFLLTTLGVNYQEPGTLPIDPLDYDGQPGHGTRTCSVLCGNLPGEFVGVAPALPTVPYRVTDTVVLSSKRRRRGVANAIRHAFDLNACDVVSISLGWPFPSIFSDRPLGEAVDYAYDRGLIVVAAGGQVIDRVSYPGKYYRSIGVGGVRPDYTAWQEYGDGQQSFIDVWGPADDVYRASTSRGAQGNDVFSYGYGDGTSYATAHVAAAAAMWLLYREDDIESAYDAPWQRVEAFRTLLGQTSQPMAGAYQPASGTGVLDIHALLEAQLPRKSSLTYEARKAADQYL